MTEKNPTDKAGSTASLTAAVLDEEAARLDAQSERDNEVLFADDLLPGVGSEEMTLKEGLSKGGVRTFAVLLVLNSLDELEGAALSVLGPDIRDTFGVSDGTITFIAAASSAFFVLGAMPMGYLADRMRRSPIIGVASAIFSLMVVLSGFAVNAFMMFWTRFGVGIAKANTLPVHGSMIADTYPIGVRGRMGALNGVVGRAVAVLSPVLVGGIAAAAGGVEGEGWRWAYYLLGLPVAVFAALAFTLKEPIRGQWEKADVLGEATPDEEDPAPVSMEAAFARLWRIRTIKTVAVAFSAMGFSLFTGVIIANLYLEDRFGLDALERGTVGTISGLGVLVAAPFVGRYFDRVYRRDPAKAIAIIGMLLLPVAPLVVLQYLAPNVALFTVAWVLINMCQASAFAMVGPVIQAVIPYRLRGLGSALVTAYIFFVGAVGGGLLSAFLIDATSPRTTVLVLTIPSMLIGAMMIINGSRYIRNDLSLVVSELREEQEERERQLANPTEIPTIQVNAVDFSYGPVQVLFDVGFEVHRGEVLALLGTNGAGKSTILRVISGLGTPERGVVRLNGRTITYATPEQRTRMGIHLLLGGKGVFGSMSVRQNLVMAAFQYRKDAADVDRRIERVLELFPALRRDENQAAGSLSGGQQQMLALAATLLHDPEVLIIDELSLGLAPVVVQELLGVIEELKSDGLTIIIVEQSLNVALAIADRAVFLEKGRVRFEGDAQELAGRDDLARAVFLGTEGG